MKADDDDDDDSGLEGFGGGEVGTSGRDTCFICSFLNLSLLSAQAPLREGQNMEGGKPNPSS